LERLLAQAAQAEAEAVLAVIFMAQAATAVSFFTTNF
jgi:hypothetical protein